MTRFAFAGEVGRGFGALMPSPAGARGAECPLPNSPARPQGAQRPMPERWRNAGGAQFSDSQRMGSCRSVRMEAAPNFNRRTSTRWPTAAPAPAAATVEILRLPAR